jgi:putative ATPase
LVDRAAVEEALQRRTLLYDKAGDEHYGVVSAFIKSLRGSDPDAAVYWMVRMLEAGEDPLFVVRRMVIFAAEDVGNADPQGLQVAVAAMEAVRFVGLPEAVLPMSQAATYLACAPKSNSALLAYSRARKDVLDRGPLPVPLRLRNAPTRLMKEIGYSGGYRYPHDFEGHYVPERYLPEELAARRYYTPTESGHEAAIAARVRAWDAARVGAAESSTGAGSAQEVDDQHGGQGREEEVGHEGDVP